MLQEATPVMVPGGMVIEEQAASVTQVPELTNAPVARSVIVYGIFPPVVLVSQNWITLVAEGDIVENWISLPVLVGIGMPQPAAAGPAQRMNVAFSYQLICSVELALELNEIMTPGVIGLPKGVLLEAISCSGEALHAMVEGMAVPFVCRKPFPAVTVGQVMEQSVGGPPVWLKVMLPFTSA